MFQLSKTADSVGIANVFSFKNLYLFPENSYLQFKFLLIIYSEKIPSFKEKNSGK